MANISHAEFEKIWKGPVIRIGVVTIVVPMLLCFLPNVYLYMVYGVFPPWDIALKAWGMIAAIFGAMFGQFTLKYPILAVAGLGIPVGLFMGGPALGIPFLAQTWFVIVCSVFGTILIGRVLYKQHIIG